jgi:hypothetical protein
MTMTLEEILKTLDAKHNDESSTHIKEKEVEYTNKTNKGNKIEVKKSVISDKE